jgi:5-methylcytosine-specific restriction endonuclease McrA
MQKHTKNYYNSLALDSSDHLYCEYPACWALAIDIHHIEPRSKFGSKMKAAQDAPENLIALCRKHHDEAHGPKSREIKEQLKKIANIRIKNRESTGV